MNNKDFIRLAWKKRLDKKGTKGKFWHIFATTRYQYYEIVYPADVPYFCKRLR